MGLSKIRSVIGSRKSIGLIMVNYFFSFCGVSGRIKGWPLHFTNKVGIAGLEIIGGEYDLVRCLVKNSSIHIQTSNKVVIHSSVLLATGVKIISGNHDLSDLRAPSVTAQPIEIKENCWIGANAVILPGVILGPNTVVGAGAVVTKSYPNGGNVIVGNPAKIRA